MKNLFKIAAVAGLAFTLASCGAANDIYGNNGYPTTYPSGENGVYRAPDGRIYRTGDVYRDRNGNVYQSGRVVRSGDVYGQPGILGRNGTYSDGNRRNLPPGQAKKIYGGSAKDYAYGQTKKRNATYNNRNWRDDDRRYDDDRDDHKNKKYSKGKGKGKSHKH